MGDYNLNYLNADEKELLDTILVTYDFNKVTNKTVPTHSKTLIDFFFERSVKENKSHPSKQAT